MTATWRLDAAEQTILLSSENGQMPTVAYWGATLPAHIDECNVVVASRHELCKGMLDALPPLSIAPEEQLSFGGQPAMVLRDLHGNALMPRWQLQNEKYKTDKQNNTTLELTYTDSKLDIRYTATIQSVYQTNMLCLYATLKSKQPIQIQHFSAPVLPAPAHARELITFYGWWCNEFRMQKVPWKTGIHAMESRSGHNGHDYFPAVLIPCYNCSEHAGSAYGLHYGWSGGHRMIAEQLVDSRRQIQFSHAVESTQRPVTTASSSVLYACYTSQGLNGIANSFQKHVRNKIVSYPKSRQRPLHYNCWEAVYFNHNVSELQHIADMAAKLGAERFVLDDGWFSGRNDATSSLGDWTVDSSKFPDGLTPLIQHVHSIGMTFGIWMEPEMISKDSALYREHPQWLLGDPEQTSGRDQYLLNMSLPEVRQYLLKAISTLLSQYDIGYIKWDHNRTLPYPDNTQTDGIYQLLKELRSVYPQVEIESCAAGGGRIDYGMLAFTQRVWLSDSNDALTRLHMQHNALFFLPPEITGSHVGAERCHTSSRVLPMHFRAWVAATRHMGIELDPRTLTADDADTLTAVCTWWKNNRDWMFSAELIRLACADQAIIAQMYISLDKTRFVAFIGIYETLANALPIPVQLARLEPSAHYTIHLLNREQATDFSRAPLPIKHTDITLCGQYLMQYGLQLPYAHPATMWVVEGHKTAQEQHT